ncbi:hypothetical protein [Psychroserpens sp. NJDZ02]|uniref:hypothetical protein n=1 Tax=Psychroserpens sp. NJDZ02 TaxID=2570561 RepID=UPI0010A753BB|nr:hypothetical protein [Psychroserpens sp. NJDZ02]QCE40674.1 hypothetical protein E9099_04315 [Psychroserpens sp. NJDZ02]
MKITALTLGFLLLTNFSFSQIKKKELNGVWKTDKRLFSKTDTIKFYSNIKSCFQTEWSIEKGKIKTNELNICTEPNRIKRIVGEEKIKFKKKDFGQIIEYYHNGILTNKFRIIELNKKNESELKLMHFDKLTEQKLYKYVDSLVIKVLKYNPIEYINIANLSPSRRHFRLCGDPTPPEPSIIVNGYLLKNREPLKELLLAETYDITYMTKEKSAMIYGTKGVSGVIILNTSERRYKKVRKKYGR